MSDNKIVMRSKAVLSIIAFLAAFGISVAVTPRAAQTSFAPFVKKGCAETATARKITKLLSQDIENGRDRDRKLNNFSDYSPSRDAYLNSFAKTIDEYADASASIDDTDLPGDFQTAWRSHMTAWRNHSDLLSEYASAPRKRGGNADGIEFPRRQYSEQTEEISETWFEVLRVARKYDAYIPPGAY
jgi:hypothetical protein